jgi:hypothetical protein
MTMVVIPRNGCKILMLFLERDFSAVPNSENFVVCVHVQIVAIELERVELS